MDFGVSSDWTEISLAKSNVQMIFEKMKSHYFGSFLNNLNCDVNWDLLNTISENRNYSIIQKNLRYDVYISLNTLTRPRIQLISLLLHILIHLCITKASSEKISIDYHGQDFRKIMHFFNSRINSQITTGHSFFNNQEENTFKKQWWQCTGVCCSYQPFRGVFRSTIVPSEASSFWRDHLTKCGGTFFKIFEVERINANGKKEIKFARNVKYLNPRAKPEAPGNFLKRRSCSATQIRAQIDLTDDVPQEKNLCTVINLDESEYVTADSDDEREESLYSQKIISTIGSKILSTCCLCQVVIGESRIASHFDSCMGYKQNVVFSLK